MAVLRIASAALAAVMVVTAACSSSTNSDGSADGSGGSGGSGYIPPTCGQECQDYLVAYALTDAIWFLWNSQIAGHPSGATDTTGSCPLGGSAKITGTTSVSGTLNTADLVFELQGCASSEQSYELTFTGSVSMDGTFDDGISRAMTFDAPSLEAAGTLHYYDDTPIDDVCDTRIAQQGSDASTSGTRCGRTFDEGALGSGGSGSGDSADSGPDATSGSGGTGSCACTCPDGNDCTDATTPNPCGVDGNGIPEPCACPVDCN